MEQVQADRKASLKSRVQKLGSTLSSMVIPNIGALIAWGVLTALFIPMAICQMNPLLQWSVRC